MGKTLLKSAAIYDLGVRSFFPLVSIKFDNKQRAQVGFQVDKMYKNVRGETGSASSK